MSERAAFLSAILAAPDDDVPRLLLADWLDENGDAARAAFIRVQCELARLPACPTTSVDGGFAPNPCQCQWHTLHRRAKVLVEAKADGGNHWNWQDWAAPAATLLTPFGMPWTHANYIFRRGFVEEIACSWEDWTRHAAAILAATPLRQVRLTTPPRWHQIVNASWALPPGRGAAELVAELTARWPGITFRWTDEWSSFTPDPRSLPAPPRVG